MTRKPLFSILHTSARPDKWRAVYDDWMSKAVHPEQVQYVLCIDPRWGFSTEPEEYDVCAANGFGKAETGYRAKVSNLEVVQNTGRRCYVDGVNIAARASSGSILIVNADDQFACDGWDEDLRHVLLRNCGGWAPESLRGEANFVIEVSTGTPQEHERRIMVMPILSRQRYEDQGSEIFYHQYESMCADNDFCEHAKQDGVVIDARYLLFRHKHPMIASDGGWVPMVSEEAWDQAYRWQNRQEASDAGMALLKRRRVAKFQPVSDKRCVAMCYPGDLYAGVMVDHLMALYAHLIERDFAVLRIRSYSTIVYQTREDMRRTIMGQKDRPELILWMDDDNPLRPDQFDQLLEDLEAHPEVDGIAGWCWRYDHAKQISGTSCGLWAPDHLQWQPFDSTFARSIELRSFECGGLPCMLMRLSALEKAGDMPFLPILDNRLEHGVLGEDFAFFLRAEQGGAKFLVDPKVRVPHLKYVDLEPILEHEGAPPPVKVACMMRVKNEGRWIRRVIEAVRPLCGDEIYVMEDGSTDGTYQILAACGVHLLPSPFEGLGLDERRDKNWLLAEVKRRCPDADWILMPDGDEELEPTGCEKIRRVLERNPNVDVFALRILNLWDSVDQIRLDGAYGRMARQSLFRASSKLEFKSYYENEGANTNHVGLHVSNAPGIGQPARIAPLNVALLHYGYVHREDRIRKFDWISKLDPNNAEEDYYSHTIQGDPFPDGTIKIPVDVKLKHAGPLDLRKLPAHLIPKFEGEVPGPFAPVNDAVMTAGD